MTGSGGSSGSDSGDGGTTPGLNTGAGPWGAPVPGAPTASGTMVTGTVTVNKATVKGTVGSHFQGFIYEKKHLTNASFTGQNANLIALYKLIGPVNIRIGANDVERCKWTESTPFDGNGQPSGQPFGSTIGSVMVDGLNDLLTAANATVIYGINYTFNDPANDALEAAYAAPKLGARLVGFEIGNELDKYGGWAGEKGQWESIASAVVQAVPNATFAGMAATAGGPTSHNVPFAAAETVKYSGKIVTLTQHYYIGPAGTNALSSMQTVKSDIPTISATVNTAATSNHVPNGYRFGEANSFWGHGQPGLSDKLIAPLWGLDLMFTIAQNGATGINFHGGETGMDGTLPFSYTPIVENGGQVTGVAPLYYGMLLFYVAGQCPLLGTTIATSISNTNPNFTAYAIGYTADGSTSVVLVNKNAMTGVDVTVDLGAPVKSASAIYLQGTAPNNLTVANVTVAGATVSPQGTWARNPPFTLPTTGNTVSVFVPPASAALVRAL